MTLTRLWSLGGIGLSLGMVSIALALRDCMLFAVSTVLAYRLSLVHMDRGAPWRTLPAAFNALSIGLAAGVAGILLMAGVGAALAQWWQPEPNHPASVWFTLFAGAALCCVGRYESEGASAEVWPWLWLAIGVLAAFEARWRGMDVAPCVLVLVVGALLVRAGWRLATLSAPSMLRGGRARN